MEVAFYAASLQSFRKGRRAGGEGLIAPVEEGELRAIRKIPSLQPDHIVWDIVPAAAHDLSHRPHVLRGDQDIPLIQLPHPLPFLRAVRAASGGDRHDISRHGDIAAAVIDVGNHPERQGAAGGASEHGDMRRGIAFQQKPIALMDHLVGLRHRILRAERIIGDKDIESALLCKAQSLFDRARSWRRDHPAADEE